MSKGFPAEGGCACGHVRYRMATAPIFVHGCHCTWCQRETGSAFATNAMIERNRLTLLGADPVAVMTPSASGKGQTILRCPRCRVALWSHYAGVGPAIAFLRVGTLDDATLLQPDIHIYTSTKQPWVRLPEDKPAVPEYYSAKEMWPAESLARARVVRSA